jgi:hypothetical protein
MLHNHTDKEEAHRYIAEALGSNRGNAALHLCHLSRHPPQPLSGRCIRVPVVGPLEGSNEAYRSLSPDRRR